MPPETQVLYQVGIDSNAISEQLAIQIYIHSCLSKLSRLMCHLSKKKMITPLGMMYWPSKYFSLSEKGYCGLVMSNASHAHHPDWAEK
jgi:hypothetical protein